MWFEIWDGERMGRQCENSLVTKGEVRLDYAPLQSGGAREGFKLYKMTGTIGKVKTQFFEFNDKKKPLKLRVGATLPRFTLAYETYGRMNADRSNVILLY